MTLSGVAVGYERFGGPLLPPSQSQSHFATDGQSVSVSSWLRAPSEIHDQIFVLVRTLVVSVVGRPP